MHDRFGLGRSVGALVDVQLDLFYKLGPQFDGAVGVAEARGASSSDWGER